MNPLDYFLSVVRTKYAEFNGRARRAEYWYFALVSLGISIALAIVGRVIGTTLLSSLYGLAVLVPGIAVGIRRLHDIDKSGWYLLVLLIPLAGFIWLLVLLCTEGTRGPNEYGPDPKDGLTDGGMGTGSNLGAGSSPDFGAGSGPGSTPDFGANR